MRSPAVRWTPSMSRQKWLKWRDDTWLPMTTTSCNLAPIAPLPTPHRGTLSKRKREWVVRLGQRGSCGVGGVGCPRSRSDAHLGVRSISHGDAGRPHLWLQHQRTVTTTGWSQRGLPGSSRKSSHLGFVLVSFYRCVVPPPLLCEIRNRVLFIFYFQLFSHHEPSSHVVDGSGV